MSRMGVITSAAISAATKAREDDLRNVVELEARQVAATAEAEADVDLDEIQRDEYQRAVEAVRQWTGSDELQDDITLLIARRV